MPVLPPFCKKVSGIVPVEDPEGSWFLGESPENLLQEQSPQIPAGILCTINFSVEDSGGSFSSSRSDDLSDVGDLREDLLLFQV